MKRVSVVLFISSILVLVSLPVWAVPAKLSTDLARYREGEVVTITVSNTGRRALRLNKPISIVDGSSGETVAAYVWEGSRRLEPGGSLVWRWDQWRGECSGDCARPAIHPPDLVGPGRYKAIVETSRGTFSRRFSIGEFFTLGFEGRDETFSLFTHLPEVIDQLRAEAEAEDKSLIVSGIVRRGTHRYNPDWSFHMGPGSIVTGEFFMEVCDASPGYVEENLDDWVGERWCPWSSYVQSAGRP